MVTRGVVAHILLFPCGECDHMGFFEEPKATNRFIVLSDMMQVTPAKVKVWNAFQKESGAGTKYSVLQVEDEEGNKFDISVFSRDVKACILEWGTEPNQWGWIEFLKTPSRNRLELVPAKEQPVIVHMVQ